MADVKSVLLVPCTSHPPLEATCFEEIAADLLILETTAELNEGKNT